MDIKVGFNDPSYKRKDKYDEEYSLLTKLGDDYIKPRYMVDGYSESKKELPEGHSLELTNTPNKIKLRDFQEPAMKAIRDGFVKSNEVSVTLRTGFGKTIIGIETALHLGYKTIICVPIEKLLVNFHKTLIEMYGIHESDIGVLGTDKDPYKPFMLSTIHQLSLNTCIKKLDNDKIKEYGTIIVDEMHRSASDEFSRVFAVVPARYRLGMTGTHERADGKHIVAEYHLGKPVFVDLTSGASETPIVKLINYKSNSRCWWPDLGKPVLSDKCLRENSKRCEMIGTIADNMVKNGRTVIILTLSIEHMNKISDHIRTPDKVLFYSKTKQADRDFALNGAKIIIGTVGSLATGVDIPHASSLILASCLGNVITQAIGRITRLHPGKPKPVIVDIVDQNHKNFALTAKIRNRAYEKIGCKVSNYDLSKLRRM